MLYGYQRSQILDFYDLNQEQQTEVDEDLREDRFVLYGQSVLPLSHFMRSEGRFHGIMSCTNTSAYGIIISRCGDSAVVALIG